MPPWGEAACYASWCAMGVCVFRRNEAGAVLQVDASVLVDLFPSPATRHPRKEPSHTDSYLPLMTNCTYFSWEFNTSRTSLLFPLSVPPTLSRRVDHQCISHQVLSARIQYHSYPVWLSVAVYPIRSIYLFFGDRSC